MILGVRQLTMQQVILHHIGLKAGRGVIRRSGGQRFQFSGDHKMMPTRGNRCDCRRRLAIQGDGRLLKAGQRHRHFRAGFRRHGHVQIQLIGAQFPCHRHLTVRRGDPAMGPLQIAEGRPDGNGFKARGSGRDAQDAGG